MALLLFESQNIFVTGVGEELPLHCLVCQDDQQHEVSRGCNLNTACRGKAACLNRRTSQDLHLEEDCAYVDIQVFGRTFTWMKLDISQKKNGVIATCVSVEACRRPTRSYQLLR